MQPARLDLRVDKGATFAAVLRIMQPSLIYKAITAIAATAPVQLTVEHGLPTDWPVWVEQAQQLQALNRAPQRTTPHMARVVDADTLEINTINAAGTNAKGGQLVYQAPLDLTGATAVLQLLDEGAAVGTLPVTVNAGGWLDVALTAAETAALDWAEREYVVDVTLQSGEVLRAFAGTVAVVVAGAKAGQPCSGLAVVGGDKGPRGAQAATVVFNDDGSMTTTLEDGQQIISDPSPVVDTVVGAKDEAVVASGVAVTASSTATTKAGEAAASEAVALLKASEAVSAAAVSQNAASNSVVNANLYSDVAEGLSSGDAQFQVQVGDEYIRYRRDAGPVATEIGRYPAVTAVNALSERIKDAAPGDAISFEDEDGAIAALFDENGKIHASAARVEHLETQETEFASPSSTLAQSVSDVLGGEAYGADEEGNFHTPAIITRTINQIPVSGFSRKALQVFAANRFGVENGGQSNGEGRMDAQHTTQVFDAVGFAAHATAPTTLLPMTAANCSTGGNREVPAFGAIDYMKQLVASELGVEYTDHEYQPVLINTAYSGFTIAQLSDGTAAYNEFVGQVQAAYDISQADGKTFAHLFNVWTQGEGDGRSPWEAYYSELIKYHNGRQAAARAITGQAEPVYTITSQMNSIGTDFVQSVAIAALKASEDHPHIVMSCPTYMGEFVDDAHRTGAALEIEGAYAGIAAFMTLVRGIKFEPLKAVSSRLQGRIQEVTFNKTGLVFGTSSAVPSVPQYGFQMINPGGAEIALESAAITGPSTVRFVWASAPQAGSMWWAGGKRITSGKGSYLGSCINLRDSQGEQFIYNSTPLHNWAVVQTLDPRGI